MDDSEKRGRGIVARRLQQQQQQQQQQQPSLVTPMAEPPPPRSPQGKSRRKMNDFMLGVVERLNARKNNGAIQTPTPNIPRHFDFSYRDRNDVTGKKRRFQVKVPCRLMVILALVFLLIPGMVFLHKELHIHEDHYISHYKGENYVNVNTKDVWDNFKLATTTDDTQGFEVNTTVVKHQDHTSHSGDNALQQNLTVVESVVAKNETKPIAESPEDAERDVANEEDHAASNEQSSPEEEESEAVDEEDHDESPSGDNSLVAGKDNKIEQSDTKNLGTATTNSTTTKNTSDR